MNQRKWKLIDTLQNHGRICGKRRCLIRIRVFSRLKLDSRMKFGCRGSLRVCNLEWDDGIWSLEVFHVIFDYLFDASNVILRTLLGSPIRLPTSHTDCTLWTKVSPNWIVLSYLNNAQLPNSICIAAACRSKWPSSKTPFFQTSLLWMQMNRHFIGNIRGFKMR